jgi:non-specific serine/threonine protein kinase
VSQVLGIRNPSTRRHADLVAEFLRAKRLLLVLDACERHARECGELSDQLLRAAPGLRILATSRMPLHVPGEHVYPLAPLPVDAPGETTSDATELFRARAATIPGVELHDGDLHQVAELCRQLDGIPLAIELAAARLSVLSTRQITDRLDQRFHRAGRLPRRRAAAPHAAGGHRQQLRAVPTGSAAAVGAA